MLDNIRGRHFLNDKKAKEYIKTKKQKEQTGGKRGQDEVWTIMGEQILMPLCGMSASFSAQVLASHLAVHEFEVDSLQSDLKKSTFPGLHVLDGELSAQFWTWWKKSSTLDS